MTQVPTYEYACKECGEHLDVVQKFTDDALTTCPSCQGPLRKVFGSIGISFKGSGFYKNDSRSDNGSKKADTQKAEPAKAGDGASSGGSDSSAAAKADTGSSSSGKSDTAKSDKAKNGSPTNGAPKTAAPKAAS